MLVIRCKNCGKVLEEHPSQLRCCQCQNLTSIRGGNISGIDLSLVEIINAPSKKQIKTNNQLLSREDIAWQEERKQRKIRKLDFEIR